MLYTLQSEFLQTFRGSKSFHKRFDLQIGLALDGTDKGLITRSPSLSVNCHSEKSKVSLSSFGNPRVLPPQGDSPNVSRSSLNKDSDQSRHIESLT